MRFDRREWTSLAGCVTVAGTLLGLVSCGQYPVPIGKEQGDRPASGSADPLERLIASSEQSSAEAAELAGRKPPEPVVFAKLVKAHAQ